MEKERNTKDEYNGFAHSPKFPSCQLYLYSNSALLLIKILRRNGAMGKLS